jgi:hypothetical protein
VLFGGIFTNKCGLRFPSKLARMVDSQDSKFAVGCSTWDIPCYSGSSLCRSDASEVVLASTTAQRCRPGVVRCIVSWVTVRSVTPVHMIALVVA